MKITHTIISCWHKHVRGFALGFCAGAVGTACALTAGHFAARLIPSVPTRVPLQHAAPEEILQPITPAPVTVPAVPQIVEPEPQRAPAPVIEPSVPSARPEPVERVPPVPSPTPQPTIEPSVPSVPSVPSPPPSPFPSFTRAIFPVSQTPDWARLPREKWNAPYGELAADDLVPAPPYDRTVFTESLKQLAEDKEKNALKINTILFYSTRFRGRYATDSDEGEGDHHGIDLKLASGTPVGAIAGGRVLRVATSAILGIHAVIEHRLPDGRTVLSVYAHMGSANVRDGQDVVPGTTVGVVGMTGNTSGPHLHLQTDAWNGGDVRGYDPLTVPSDDWLNPISFISAH